MSEHTSANLFKLFRSRFPKDRASLFLRTNDDNRYSYDDLENFSSRYAHVLTDRGLKPGDRVATQIEKSPEAVFLYLACLKAGGVFLPLNTAYQADELEYFLDDAEPSIVVGDSRRKDLAGLCAARSKTVYVTLDADGSGTLPNASAEKPSQFQCVDRSESDLAAILYSSGTTGRPKGVMLSHANLAANASALHEVWGFAKDDILLHALPIFHTHGLFVAINTVLLNGTGMIFHNKFNADAVAGDLPDATVFMGVPTYYVRLLSCDTFTRDSCRNIRLFLCGSAPLLDETFKQFEGRTGKQIVERYGMTEAGIITSADPRKPRKAGDVGWPLPGVSLRIAGENNQDLAPGETGEILIRGPGLFSGYWRKPEKTAEEFTADGYFKTGDLAQLDENGMVAIVGRAKDMIISGGFNVYPKEIEAIVDGLPAVDESAVVGMPHPDFGEAGMAVITLLTGEEFDESAAKQILKKELANYKVPKFFVIADELPRNAMGKVQKNVLRERFQADWNAHLKTSTA